MTSNAAASNAAPGRPRRSLITRLATLSAGNWTVTAAAWNAILAVGILAFAGGLAREGFPTVNLPVVVIEGTYFVDDPEIVDRDISSPMHEAYGSTEGIVEVQTWSLDNSFLAVVEFDDDFSSPQGADLLNQVNAGIGLPSEAQINVQAIDAAKFLEEYDVLVSVTGPPEAAAADLQREANKLQGFLEEHAAVATAEVRNLLTDGVDPATGEQQTRRTQFIRVALPDSESYQEAIVVGLVRSETSDLDALSFTDSINERLAADSPLADGFEAAITADFATNIRSQISNLTGNLFNGLLAVALVSLLLIGWRVSLVTAGFMATVMLAALATLWFIGYSLNTITLFGLILTLGLLVDDAIVISESIDANRDESDDAVEVVGSAVSRVGSASLAGTLTTVLVFTPMAFVSGVLGSFIRAIPITVIITLVLSFVFSIVLIPAIAKPFLLRGKRPDGPLVRGQRVAARALGRLAEYPSSHGLKGIAVGLAIVLGAGAIVAGSFSIASTLGFNIFPSGDDTNALSVKITFAPGTTIEQAQERSRQVDDAVVSVLGPDLLRSQYAWGDSQSTFTFIDLVPFDQRETKAPAYVEQLEEAVSGLGGMRVSISTLANAPPVEEFPFAAQITVPGDDATTSNQLAEELRVALNQTELDKANAEKTSITEAIISTEGLVFRTDGQRQVEVRAKFSNDDLTSNLTATENLVTELFDSQSLAKRGLAPDAIAFDYGQESNNQEDFASLTKALLVALVLMLLLLIVQFRSVVQPLLVFLAIPFSFFGVFSILSLSDNPISFFVAVGFIALIGVVVNNSILLVDAANQARRDGMRAGEAIGYAVTRRFRPLVATTLTTVVGLLPLALSDPFWEALSFTLIGGLLSSTVLVLVAFPVFYLAVERVRTPLRNMARRRLGWDPV